MPIIHNWKQTNSKHQKVRDNHGGSSTHVIYDEYMCVTEDDKFIIYDECVYMDVYACMCDLLFYYIKTCNKEFNLIISLLFNKLS